MSKCIRNQHGTAAANKDQFFRIPMKPLALIPMRQTEVNSRIGGGAHFVASIHSV